MRSVFVLFLAGCVSWETEGAWTEDRRRIAAEYRAHERPVFAACSSGAAQWSLTVTLEDPVAEKQYTIGSSDIEVYYSNREGSEAPYAPQVEWGKGTVTVIRFESGILVLDFDLEILRIGPNEARVLDRFRKRLEFQGAELMGGPEMRNRLKPPE